MSTKTQTLEALAERIDRAVKACVARGVTRDDLAERLGYKNTTTVSKWANGSQVPGAENLMRLTAVLEVSGHWLLTGEGEERYEGGRDTREMEIKSRYFDRMVKLVDSGIGELTDLDPD